jgi:hypothetical protein
MLTAAGMSTGETDGGSGEWTKIVIREAFISRQTSIDFRDSNSPPEFGWHVMRGLSRAARGNGLYATMFVPFPAAEPLRLLLVERDVFSDDIVSGVNLERGKTKYVLNANGDFVVLERTPFFPDGKSGDDALPESAAELKGDVSGGVSFLDGDYTDCFRLPAGPSAAMVISGSMSLAVDAPGGDGVIIHPRSRAMTGVRIAVSDTGGVIRVRGPVGGGKTAYRIYASSGKNGFAEIFGKAVKHLEAETAEPSFVAYRDMARTFLSYDRNAAMSRCAGETGPGAGRFGRMCEAVVAETKATSP